MDSTLSLNEAVFIANRSGLASELMRANQLDASAERELTFVTGFYNREILKIAQDYVDELRMLNRVRIP